jgi:hypothetical protein
MSATLNFNPIKYYSWKGRTFSQITTNIQKNIGIISINTDVRSQESNQNLFKSRPLKIHRREIASIVPEKCSRSSISIDELNMPNGSIVNSKNNNGLVNTLDINSTTNQYDTASAKCNTMDTCISQEANARRRVRSSGMIRKKYNPLNANAPIANATYYTNASQYLNSRNMTFQQNQSINVKDSGVNSTPGTVAAQSNVYSTGSVNGCPHTIYYKPNNPQFAQQGGVSSSSRLLRKKVDTITSVGATYKTPFGMGMANAMAYGVPQANYTIKDKLGYPQKCTPTVTKTGEYVKVTNTSICSA